MLGTEKGDSITGEVIICEARVVSKPILMHKTGRHRAQRLKLKGNPAFCYIDKPFRKKK